MTVQYVSVNAVKERLPSSYDGSDDYILEDIITAASAFLDRYTNVANGGYAVQTYDELYNGTGDSLLFLNNRPIQSIERIATVELPALSLHNTNPDIAARAWVSLVGLTSNPINLNSQSTSTGIKLQTLFNNVSTSNTLLWTSYPTVSQLVTAINALGNQWTAQTMSGMNTRSCSDLRFTQGGFEARQVTCYLWIHWMALPWFRINENTGEVYSPMGFARGVYNWRAVYTAGYTSFPDDLTQVLCEVVVNTYMRRNLNANLQSESLGGYSYTMAAAKEFEQLSPMSKRTLGAYRRHPVSHFSTW